MIDPIGPTRYRAELQDTLERGAEKIALLMRDRSRAVPAKTILVDAHGECDAVYRVRRGVIGRVRTLKDGRSQCILIFLPGDLFAMKSMFVERHPDRIEALAASVIEQVDQRVLKAAFDADPDIASRCIWQVMEEERRLHDWVVGLGQGRAEERTAMLLLDLRTRLIAAGVVPDGALGFDFPVTQQHLADHVGATTVHLNRVLRGLREAGVVTIRGQRVTIDDLRALERLAEPLLDVGSGTSAAAGHGRPAQPDAGSGS